MAILASTALIAAPATAGAHEPDHGGGTHPPTGGGGPDLHTNNMTLIKSLPKVDGAAQSDLAFEGDYAYAGTFSGFRIIDISDATTAHQVAFKS